MKKLLIAAVALLPFLGSCDKNKCDCEPDDVLTDTIYVRDTIVDTLLQTYIETLVPFPDYYVQLEKQYPNYRFWYYKRKELLVGGCSDSGYGMFGDIYCGKDTMVDGENCIKLFYVKNINADIKWENIGLLFENDGMVQVDRYFDYEHCIDTIFDYNLRNNDTLNIKLWKFYVCSVVLDSVYELCGHSSYCLTQTETGAMSKWMENIGYIIFNVGYMEEGCVLLRYYEKGEVLYEDKSDSMLFVDKYNCPY